MIQYESERYLDFEVMTSVEEGLKIPVSSVTSKNFYLVPVDFLEQGGDSDDSGFLKEVYTESGTSVEFTPVTIYYSTEEYYYIDTAEDEPIHAGDYLVKPGSSSERYQWALRRRCRVCTTSTGDMPYSSRSRFWKKTESFIPLRKTPVTD